MPTRARPATLWAGHQRLRRLGGSVAFTWPPAPTPSPHPPFLETFGTTCPVLYMPSRVATTIWHARFLVAGEDRAILYRTLMEGLTPRQRHTGGEEAS